jgi:hypothetical protein
MLLTEDFCLRDWVSLTRAGQKVFGSHMTKRNGPSNPPFQADNCRSVHNKLPFDTFVISISTYSAYFVQIFASESGLRTISTQKCPTGKVLDSYDCAAENR